jgi:Protein of unknown function (DUF3292)
MCLTTLIIIIVYPPFRIFLFPPVPLALVDAKSGGIQRPAAGELGSYSSLTGAPEKHKGEALEQEASNFVSTFADITLSAAAGKHPENNLEDLNGTIDRSIPDPTKIATGAAEAKKTTSDGTPVEHDKTKDPVQKAMWSKLSPIMRMIGDIADTWERFGKYICLSDGR